jgi:fructoselysine-6-P-deglycase FrlB-like protein
MPYDRPMRSADYALMRRELHDLPDVIQRLSAQLAQLTGDVRPSRVLVVGYGANLNAARVMEASIARRGVGMRFATPERAQLLQGETLVCLSRSAASDSVMQILETSDAPDGRVLITAEPDASAARRAQDAGCEVIPLGLGGARPTVATQSVFAIIMALDWLLDDDRSERLALWDDVASSIKLRLKQLEVRAQGRAQVAALADRLLLIGDDTMEAVGHSLSLTLMELVPMAALTIPLSAGLRGPIMHLGDRDMAILLGHGGEAFARYRRAAGYSIQLAPPADESELTCAVHALLEGQLFALELARHRQL